MCNIESFKIDLKALPQGKTSLEYKLDDDIMVWEILYHLYALGSTAIHIVDDMVKHLIQTGRNRLWQ